MTTKQQKQSVLARRLIIIGATLLVTIVIGAGVAYWLYADKMQSMVTAATNDYIKGLIERDDANTGGKSKMTVTLGVVDYGFFARTLDVKDAYITMGAEDDPSATYMEIRIPRVHCTGVNPWDILFGDGLSLGDITIDQPSVFRRPGVIRPSEQPELVVKAKSEIKDSALVKLPRLPDVDSLVGTLVGAILPNNIKPLWVNSLTVKEAVYVLADPDRSHTTGGSMVGLNIRFNRLSIRDTSEAYKAVAQTYLSVRRWTRPFDDGDTVKIYGGRIVVDEKDSSMYVDSVQYLVPNATRTFASGIHISFRNRSLAIDTFSYMPTISDAAVFAKTKFRSDRARVSAHKIMLRDIDTKGLVDGTALKASTLDFAEFYIDVLSNSRGTKRKGHVPQMPYQQVATIPFRLGIDSVRVANTTIVYGELHPKSNTPAILQFERIRFLVTGLSNDPEVQKKQPVKIHGKGAFQKNGVMDIVITLPLNVKQNTFDVEANLKEMDLRTFNTFLPVAENIKVKNGWVKTASVKLKVRGNKSTGVVSPQYIDFELIVLDSKTKKSGFWEDIASFLANWLKIKNENVPGPEMKTGVIAYTIPRDASVFQALWFPVRDGLGQVIGF